MQGEVSGLYRAPVTKAWLGASLGISLAAVVGKLDPILAIKEPFFAQPSWKFLVNPFLMPTTQDMLFGAVLLYSFRSLERRLGARKFAVGILSMSIISTCTQLAVATMMHRKVLHPSSTALLFALSTLFITLVPKSQSFTLLGSSFTLSDKFYVYLMLFQLAITNPAESYIAAGSGIFAGIFYRAALWNVAFPISVGNFFNEYFGWFQSQAPTLAARGRRVRTVSGTGVPYEDRLLGGDDDDMHGAAATPVPFAPRGRNNNNNNNNSNNNNVAPPSEENIQHLMAMGFPRSRCEEALIATGNNIAHATEYLLSS